MAGKLRASAQNAGSGWWEGRHPRL